jgi:hypothetical protein
MNLQCLKSTVLRMVPSVIEVRVVFLFFLSIQTSTDAEPTELSAEERLLHLKRMQAIAKSITVNEIHADQQIPARLVDEPLLRYTDDTRKTYDSTMWIWGAKGRPTAILAIEFYPERPDTKWLFEIASLSKRRIRVDIENGLHWTAREPGLRLITLENAPAPADTPALRLTQMKQLHRRFEAYERAVVGGRIELRPMIRQLHRYQDAEQNVTDGAIFAFAHGTNPEVLWIIEAHQKGKAPPHWEFALVQTAGAELFVELDGKEIWTRGEADPPVERDAYVNGWLASESKPKE